MAIYLNSNNCYLCIEDDVRTEVTYWSVKESEFHGSARIEVYTSNSIDIDLYLANGYFYITEDIFNAAYINAEYQIRRYRTKTVLIES